MPANVAMNVAMKQRGFTLVELLVATAAGAMLLAALTSLAREGVQTRSLSRDTSEAVYQARFALQRAAVDAKAAAPHSLLPTAANRSGDWFAPAAFCVNGAGALIETTTSDSSCSGTQVVAERVSAFAVSLPAGAGPLEATSAIVSITLTGPNGGGAITLTERVRLGGGTQ